MADSLRGESISPGCLWFERQVRNGTQTLRGLPGSPLGAPRRRGRARRTAIDTPRHKGRGGASLSLCQSAREEPARNRRQAVRVSTLEGTKPKGASDRVWALTRPLRPEDSPEGQSPEVAARPLLARICLRPTTRRGKRHVGPSPAETSRDTFGKEKAPKGTKSHERCRHETRPTRAWGE
jgi:hypothetical protein